MHLPLSPRCFRLCPTPCAGQQTVFGFYTSLRLDVWIENNMMAGRMFHVSIKRRDFLQAGAAGMVTAFAPPALAAGTRYDPAAKFDLRVSELEFRRTAMGRSLQARVYQPSGSGPFPFVLSLHGGAWNAKDRSAEEPFNRAIAAAGALVVAVGLTLAPEAP